MLLLSQCCEKSEGSLAPQHVLCLLPWLCWLQPCVTAMGLLGHSYLLQSPPASCPGMLWPVTLKLLRQVGAGAQVGCDWE